ncbi:MAG TPA: hypothetical protein VE263_00795 [Candidatus Angelobacter sp.]|nr:hypothetical protein [Candidatus Angelobacter sp.]
MWSLLRKNNAECRRTQDSLEEIAERRLNASSVQEWIEELPADGRAHIDACGLCREAADDLMATRRLFRGVSGSGKADRPFFAARVMAAIASQERELANLISPWSEVPRFASRLAWVAALVLLLGTTWFYEKGLIAPRATGGDTGQESIFEPPPPAGQDDALISMVEMHP